jgi:hypothetical protein
MAKDFSKEQQATIGEALTVYADELLKVYKKTVKLGLPEYRSCAMRSALARMCRQRRACAATADNGMARYDQGDDTGDPIPDDAEDGRDVEEIQPSEKGDDIKQERGDSDEEN